MATWTPDSGKRFAGVAADDDLAAALRPLVESPAFDAALRLAARSGTESAGRVDRQLRGVKNLYARLSARLDTASGLTPRQSRKETTGNGDIQRVSL